VKFKNFVQLQRGFDLPQQDRIYGKYPIIASTSITAYHNSFKVKAPCVTTGRSGALGEVLYINQDCWPLNTTLWVKDFKSNHPKFVYYKLKTLGLEKFNAGAGVPTLNRNHLDEIDITLPDLPTQSRIASVLSAYDDLIENNEKRIKVLEEMAQRLYTEWFVHFRFPGHEKVEMVDSGTEYGMIPEGWEVQELYSLISIISGFSFKSSTYQEDGKYKIVTIKNVQDGEFILNFTSFINDLPTNLPKPCLLNRGDILLSLTGNVGRVCIVYGNNHLLNQRVAKLDPVIPAAREFVYSMFRRREFQQKMESMSNGAAQQNLSPIQVKEVKIIIPESKILAEFSSLTAEYFDLLVFLQERNLTLSNVRDLLISQLVTGVRALK